MKEDTKTIWLGGKEYRVSTANPIQMGETPSGFVYEIKPPAKSLYERYAEKTGCKTYEDGYATMPAMHLLCTYIEDITKCNEVLEKRVEELDKREEVLFRTLKRLAQETLEPGEFRADFCYEMDVKFKEAKK